MACDSRSLGSISIEIRLTVDSLSDDTICISSWVSSFYSLTIAPCRTIETRQIKTSSRHSHLVGVVIMSAPNILIGNREYSSDRTERCTCRKHLTSFTYITSLAVRYTYDRHLVRNSSVCKCYERYTGSIEIDSKSVRFTCCQCTCNILKFSAFQFKDMRLSYTIGIDRRTCHIRDTILRIDCKCRITLHDQ